MAKITNEAGTEVDFEAAVNLMDDGLRDALHDEALSSEQEFFNAYCARHRLQFGEEFEPNKRNPVW